ncbi:MAG: type II secretion system F family protein [Bacteroidales bacterium]|nr:type II secretion system F family protein [Bacteroidales bacterium]
MPPIDISEIKQDSGKEKRTSPIADKLVEVLSTDISLGRKEFSDKKKLNFYSDLRMLMYSGVDIRTAFEIVTGNFNKKKDREKLDQIKENIVQGHSLSESFNQSKGFSAYEVFSVKIGEETGRLNDVLGELSGYFKKKIEQKRKIISAFSYPVIVMLTAVGAIVFMMYFIVPMFEEIFKRFDSELPGITKMIINISHGFSRYFLVFCIVIAALAAMRWLNRGSQVYKKFSSLLLMKVPVFGELVRKINMARFCMGMELLLSSKTPILNAIGLMKQMITYYPIQSTLETISLELLQGRQLYQGMEQFRVFDNRMTSLVKVAEEVNKLDMIFAQLKDQYNSEVDYLTGNINSIMEPVLIIFIGLFVGIILVSMYLPMFQLGTTIQF